MHVFGPLRDRGYLLSRTLGWLLAGVADVDDGQAAALLPIPCWGAWLAVGVLGVVGGALAWRDRWSIGQMLKTQWPLLLAQEGLFAAAYLGFLLIRMANPDLWQPWHGGEKFMEFGFLNGILRSPTFPPVDPDFAGGYINYYYYGLYLVAYLIKLTGIYAEVAFNLTIALLFALTVANAFSVAHTFAGSNGRGRTGARDSPRRWPRRSVSRCWGTSMALRRSCVNWRVGGAWRRYRARCRVPRRWRPRWPVRCRWCKRRLRCRRMTFGGRAGSSPTRSTSFRTGAFLFADLHPHLIAMPLAVLFVACILALLMDYGRLSSSARWPGHGRGADVLAGHAWPASTFGNCRPMRGWGCWRDDWRVS